MGRYNALPINLTPGALMPDNNIQNIQRRDYKKRTPREQAFHAIDSEREYQDKKFPTRVTGRVTSLEHHVALMHEYANKLARATDTMDATQAATTLVLMRKIAAIAVRCMEDFGAPVRE